MTWRRFLLGASMLTAAVGTAQAEPKVVASIQPVHSLAAALMAGVGEPYLLVKGGGSPHSYSLRPSEAEALDEAQLVFWVGEGLENFLAKPLASLGEGAKVVELLDLDGIAKIASGDHGHEDDHDEHEAHEGEEAHDEHDREKEEDDHGHHHGAIDAHIWLDPTNALVIVDAMSQALQDVDPANQGVYQQNARTVSDRLRALDHNLHERLESIENKPYVVFHDAYSYFERRYHLSKVTSITVNPERKPGAAHLQEVREKISESGASCVFAEPQFQPKIVQTVVQDLDVKTGELDPLGAGIEPGEDAYFQLMENLAGSLIGCLKE